jgi:hypothetical protein
MTDNVEPGAGSMKLGAGDRHNVVAAVHDVQDRGVYRPAVMRRPCSDATGRYARPGSAGMRSSGQGARGSSHAGDRPGLAWTWDDPFERNEVVLLPRDCR